MKINLSPIVLFLYKKYEKENISLLEYLIENQTKLTLYTSKDPDIAIPWIFTKVDVDMTKNTKTVYYRSVGETKEDSISIKQVDAIVLKNPFKLIQSQKEIGIFSKIFNSLLDRGSKLSSL